MNHMNHMNHHRIILTGRIADATPANPRRRILCSAPDCPNEVASINTICIGHTADATAKALAIIERLCAQRKVSVADVRGPRRDKHYVAARWAIVEAIRRETFLSWKQIGKILNKKHSSVIYMWRKATGTMCDPRKKGINVPFFKTVVVNSVVNS